MSGPGGHQESHETGSKVVYKLKVTPPKLLFVIDAGHGGEGPACALANTNVGTDTAHLESELKNTWKYEPPPVPGKWTAWYGFNRAGYVGERVVALELALSLSTLLTACAANSGCAPYLSVQLTRTGDYPVAIEARRKFCVDRVSKALTGTEVFTDASFIEASKPDKYEYVVFLSLHVEGMEGGPNGARFFVRLGRQDHEEPYTDALVAEFWGGTETGDPMVSGVSPLRLCTPSVDTDNHTAVGRVGVLGHTHRNIWSSLVETENIACWAGYCNLRSPYWKSEISRALARGMWRFATKVYHEALLVEEGSGLADKAKEIGDKLGAVSP